MRRTRHRLLAVPLGLVLSLAFASAASAEDFTITPTRVNPGQEITVAPVLTPAEELLIGSLGFQFENEDPRMDTTAPFAGATHAYATAGAKTVTMRIEPLAGETRFIDKPVIVNAAPVGRFTRSITVPNVGQSVSFNAGTTTDDETLANSAFEWDFDNNGTWEQAGQAVQRTFATPGDKTVRLRVTDSLGRTDTVTAVVHVNRPPVSRFLFASKTPRVNDLVEFTSVSDDPDDPITLEEWDLDGDGQYDDARGSTAAHRFAAAGNHTVRLRVRDSRGRTNTSSQTVPVTARAQALPPTMLKPWPKIRIVGFAGRTRVRVDLLTVRTSQGTTVKVRCKGRGCPRKTAVSTRDRAALVRVRWLERRLPAGTRLYVAITRPGFIGRYERILLRRKKEPLRRMLCVWPDDPKPRKCPS
jgi:PKD repeat protein